MTSVTRPTSILPALLLALAAGACTAGGGTGEAKGTLFILNCNNDQDRGTPTAKEDYDLVPDFIAAEPIQGLSGGTKVNRLIVRLQTTGRRREANDVLRFDMPNVLEVGRCVRGATVVDAGVTRALYDERNCAPTAEGARVRIGADAPVRSYFTPNSTCTGELGSIFRVVGTGVSQAAPPGQGKWDSWIEFTKFGYAGQSDRPPAMRDALTGDFKVSFDEHLTAPAFELLLQDDIVVKAQQRNEPAPEPRIGGNLTGKFDFDIQRGQGAQTFP